METFFYFYSGREFFSHFNDVHVDFFEIQIQKKNHKNQGRPGEQ
jgi:hypothetical protein